MEPRLAWDLVVASELTPLYPQVDFTITVSALRVWNFQIRDRTLFSPAANCYKLIDLILVLYCVAYLQVGIMDPVATSASELLLPDKKTPLCRLYIEEYEMKKW